MNRIRIVSLGDSLTEGMVSSSWEMYPYTEYLREFSGPGFELINKGVSGELTGQMLRRLKNDVLNLKPHYMILLGGANDIGWGIASRQIMDNLVEMCLTAWQHGIKPVLCAIPPVEGSPGANEERRRINEALEQFCKEEDIPFIDLYSPLANGAQGELRREFSDDGLHLTPDGYREMARVIYVELIEKLRGKEE